MSDRHAVSISSDNGFTAQVTVGGIDVSSTVSAARLDLDARADHHLTLTLRSFPVLAELAEVHVGIDSETHELLVRLGWTPPGGEIPCR